MPGAGPASLGRPTTRWTGAPVRPGAGPRGLDLRLTGWKQSPLWGCCQPYISGGGEDLVWATPFAVPVSFLAFLVLCIPPSPTRMEVPGPQPPSQPRLRACLRPGPGWMSRAVQQLREKFGVLSAWHLLSDLGQEGLEPSLASVSPAVSGEGADESIRWHSPHPAPGLDTPRAEIPTPGEAAVPSLPGGCCYPDSARVSQAHLGTQSSAG